MFGRLYSTGKFRTSRPDRLSWRCGNCVREQHRKSEEIGKQAAVPKLKDTSFCGGHLVRTSKVATAKSVTYKLTIPKFAKKSTVLLFPVEAECVIALEILKEEA